MAISKIYSGLGLLIGLLALLVSGSSLAQTEQTDFAEIRGFALEIEKQLRKNPPDNQVISETISTLTRYRSN